MLPPWFVYSSSVSDVTTTVQETIGIRMALGAHREQAVRLMLGDGLRPAIYGPVLGLGASAAVTRLLESMLYETKALDAWVLRW